MDEAKLTLGIARSTEATGAHSTMEAVLRGQLWLVSLKGPPAVIVMGDDVSVDAWRKDNGKDVPDEAIIARAKAIVDDANTEWVEMNWYRAALPEKWEEEEWQVDRGAIYITWNGKRWRVHDLHMGINVEDPKSIDYAKRLIADPFTKWVQRVDGNYVNDSVSQ